MIMHPRTAAAVSWWIDALSKSANNEAVTRFANVLTSALEYNAAKRGAFWSSGHAPILLRCSRLPLGLLLAVAKESAMPLRSTAWPQDTLMLIHVDYVDVLIETPPMHRVWTRDAMKDQDAIKLLA